MEQTTWNFILLELPSVFTSESQSGRERGPLKNTTLQGVVFPHSQTGWPLPRTGCRRPPLFRWLEELPLLGYGASKFLMGWTGGFVLLTTLMVPYLRKFGKATVPDFVGDRFYSNGARWSR